MTLPFEAERSKISLIKASKIGVHSGKGGVGKTFLSVNLSYSLSVLLKSKVGLLDADIDCPNVTKLLNITKILSKDQHTNLYEPIEHNGVKIISSASFNPLSENPIIIRGPIKHKMLVDFLQNTNWGNLDYLVVDLPPGTADVPLSAMQLSALDALILITTPSKEARLDTKRAANMAKKLGLKILGLVENMSGEIFGSFGEQTANELEVPFLGSIPLTKEIAEYNEKSEIAFLKLNETFSVRDKIIDAIKSHCI